MLVGWRENDRRQRREKRWNSGKSFEEARCISILLFESQRPNPTIGIADGKVECFAGRNRHNQNYFLFFPMPWNICQLTEHQARNAENWKRLLLQTSTKNTSRSKTQSSTQNISTSNIDNNSTNTNTSTTSNAAEMIRAKETVKKTNKKVQQQRHNNSKFGSKFSSNRFEALLLDEDGDKDRP
ncbi:unnamed protein product [Linum trigynum]|uniref:Uncharacterized protein n=1 Tax=Linum trigynum TaxID=586398 RepID=A0AAV2GDT4_9ROSI